MTNNSPLENLSYTKKPKNIFFTPKNLFFISLILINKVIREVLNFYYDWQDWYYIFDIALLFLTCITIYFLFKNVNTYSNKFYESESFLQVILESMKEGVIVCDTKGNITFINETMSQRGNLHYPIPFEDWKQIWKLYHSDGTRMDPKDFPLAKALIGKEVTNEEHMLKENDKPPEFYLVNGKRLFDKSGNLIGAIIVMNDITERKQAELAIKHIAYHDSLTDLPNRELFNNNLIEKMNLARQNNQTFSVMFLDLDGFKMVNDTLGHGIGDHLLKQVANRLNSCVRPQDMVSRQGGDEFMLYIDGVTVEATNKIAETILRSISFPFMLGGKEIVITPSIGISMYPTHGVEADILIKNADAAMYRSKAYGKNNFFYYTSEIENINSNKLSMANNLRKALENQEFELFYQPKVNIFKDQIVGLETLLRWNSPDFGMVSPGEFIPLAEETGLIVPIGEWVLRKAAEQNKIWQDSGFAHLTVSVNLSPRQFLQQDLVNMVALILMQTGLHSSYLTLEVTESMAMYNLKESIKKLENLKSLGIGLSLDDFGTGFSSLTYLKEFPINELKIDQTFIRDIGINPQSESIVKAIIDIAKSLNLTVVAEGVETEKQLDFLREQHCDEVQGYYFSPPVSKNEIEIILRKVSCKRDGI